MADSISFFAEGSPATAGSKNGYPFRRKGGGLGVRMVDASGARGKAWRKAVQTQFRMAHPSHKPFTGAVWLRVAFLLPRPKCHYGTGRNADRLKDSAPLAHTKKPDATKLLRAVEDALSGLAYADDAQVVRQTVHKMYCDKDAAAGAYISVLAVETVSADSWFAKAVEAGRNDHQ